MLKLNDNELHFLAELAKGCTLTSAMISSNMNTYDIAHLIVRIDSELDERKKLRAEIKKNEQEIAKLKKNTIPPIVSAKKKKKEKTTEEEEK